MSAPELSTAEAIRVAAFGLDRPEVRMHLVWVGDAQHDPCRRCGRHLESMAAGDGFTLSAAEANCVVR